MTSRDRLDPDLIPQHPQFPIISTDLRNAGVNVADQETKRRPETGT